MAVTLGGKTSGSGELILRSAGAARQPVANAVHNRSYINI